MADAIHGVVGGDQKSLDFRRTYVNAMEVLIGKKLDKDIDETKAQIAGGSATKDEPAADEKESKGGNEKKGINGADELEDDYNSEEDEDFEEGDEEDDDDEDSDDDGEDGEYDEDDEDAA